MNPFFSVIIPLYNKENYVKKTIQSVLNQTYIKFEILIINDGSTDSSLEVARAIEDSRIQIYTIENSGVSAARNLGIRKAKGNFLTFLDADDFWDISFLEQMVQLTAMYPKEYVFASAIRISTHKNIYKANYKTLPVNENESAVLDYFESSLDHSILHCAGSFFSKKLIDSIGYFDESLTTSEDTDFWIRIGLAYKIVFLNTVLSTHRVVTNGLTKSNRNSFKAIDYSKYETKNNSVFFKNYLNINKFSSAIKYKLVGDTKNFKKLKKSINNKTLNFKQKIALNLPVFLLRIATKSYSKLTQKKEYF